MYIVICQDDENLLDISIHQELFNTYEEAVSWIVLDCDNLYTYEVVKFELDRNTFIHSKTGYIYHIKSL